MCTKVSKPPGWLSIIFAILAFIMSIMWIKFTADTIMDLLQLWGFVTTLPKALFGLTVIAWGNSLGDWTADIAMTKKGFAEMAITGTMSAPVLSILLGEGLGLTLFFAIGENPWVDEESFSLWKLDQDGEQIFNPTSMLTLGLLVCQFIVLILILFDALKSDFEITFKITLINTIIYFLILAFLIIYAIQNAI